MAGYVGPEHWAALEDTRPTSREGWVSRLGQGRPGAAELAVSGAIRRGELVDDGDGKLRWVHARQLCLDALFVPPSDQVRGETR